MLDFCLSCNFLPKGWELRPKKKRSGCSVLEHWSKSVTSLGRRARKARGVLPKPLHIVLFPSSSPSPAWHQFSILPEDFWVLYTHDKNRSVSEGIGFAHRAVLLPSRCVTASTLCELRKFKHKFTKHSAVSTQMCSGKAWHFSWKATKTTESSLLEENQCPLGVVGQDWLQWTNFMTQNSYQQLLNITQEYPPV